MYIYVHIYIYMYIYIYIHMYIYLGNLLPTFFWVFFKYLVFMRAELNYLVM